MHLVCLAPRVPGPGGGAGEAYLYRHLISASRSGHDVSLVAPRTKANEAAAGALDNRIVVILSPDETKRGRLRASVRALTRGHAGTPTRDLWRSLSAQCQAAISSADVVELHFAEAIRHASAIRAQLPHLPIVATVHDVTDESLRRAIANSPELKVRVVSRLILDALVGAEVHALNACSRIYVFKSQDITHLRALGVSPSISLTMPDVRTSLPYSPNPGAQRVTFVAAFWRSENDEAAKWFLSEVWPIVRQQAPHARVRFAGGGPRDWLVRSKSDDIEVTGFIDDLSEAYADTSVVVAPLRRGAGLKFKVLQALIAGFPVVGTSVAFEGIDDWIECRSGAPVPLDVAQAFAAEVLAQLGGLRPRMQCRLRANALGSEFEEISAAQVNSYHNLPPT